jgi:GTP-binding protein LepA
MVNSKSIRNFSIIAHIDHGKSTLADRLLEVTNFKNSNKSFERVLDSLVLEKEKGITIKLNSVQLKYLDLHQKTYIFNLIDTPGHVDFMYEVSRSLAACEGVILLVDSIKGVQAQTIAYYEIAKELGLEIIPVVNKVDLPFARIEEVSEQIINLTKCEKDKIQMVSAKTGLNIENLCESIIKRINPPKVNEDKKSLKALVFDLLYNNYHGVIVYTKIVEGNLKKGQKIKLSNGKKVFKVERIGVKVPNEVLKDDLKTGDIGWFSANIKNMKEIKVGETIMDINSEEKPLDGYKEIKPNVYSNIFPAKSDSFKEFKKSLEELQIQDSSLRMESVDSKLLGPGFRCGFLGLLHREIICERITKEYDCEIITTSPSVNYRVTFQDGEVFETNNPQRLNSSRKVKSIEEIFIEIKITTPEESLGEISNLCQEKRGVYVSQD